MLEAEGIFDVAASRIDYTFSALFYGLRVGSSMVEQRPFKALVLGSSPSQPKASVIALLLEKQPAINIGRPMVLFRYHTQ